MGNCTSSWGTTDFMAASSIKEKNLFTCRRSTAAAVTVILPNGEIKILRDKTSVRAAELMLECPSFFVANARDLRVGRRFNALPADDELDMVAGSVYLMFPMRRLNSVVTEADLAAVLKTNSPPPPDRQSLDEEEEVRGPTQQLEMERSQYKHSRISRWRSRKPLLETIKEDAVYSR